MNTDQDAAAILDEILGEADALIRQRQKDRGFEFPHLVIAVTPDSQVVLRSNVSSDVLRSFSQDLKNVADELEGRGRQATRRTEVSVAACRRIVQLRTETGSSATALYL